MSLPSVLVVEDNATTRKLFRVALEAEGYRVIEAGDGKQALSQAATQAPDLVLCDLVLPDIDGVSLARQLRALPSGTSLPMVAVSGFRRLLDRACIEGDAFNDVLLKPVDLQQLLEVVGRFAAKPQPPSTLTGNEKRTVLVIDDDQVQLKLMRVRLELEGFRVITSTDSTAALGLARDSRPDVVLCDVLMPGKDGYELCRAIRSTPALANTPVVLVSAHFGGVRDDRLAEQVGASALVVRAPDIRGVVAALDAALTRAPSPIDSADFPSAEHAERVNAQLKRQARFNAHWAERSALQAAQLTILAGIGNAFARSDDVEASFGDVLGACLDTGGISRGALYRFDARERSICTHSIGFPETLQAGLGGAFGYPTLLERARAGAVVVPSSCLAEADVAAFLSAAEATAAVLVPLLGGEACMGALLLASTSSELTEPDLLRFGRAIATHVAQALATASSFERLRSASNASRTLSASLDLNETLAAFSRLATAEMADRCEIHLVDEAPFVHEAPHRQSVVAGEAGDSHTFITNLSARSRPLGTVKLTRNPARQSFQELDRLFAEDLCQRAGIAIDNALLYQASQEAGRLKDEFLTTLSHELRTPLNAILGWARLLTAGLDPVKHAQGLRVIERNAIAQTRLIEDMLDIASMLSNKTRLVLRPVELSKVIDLAVESMRLPLEEKAHALHNTGDSSVLVMADADRLQQIITNLLANAVKFTPQGGRIAIDVSAETDGKVAVSVTDNGQGIDPAFLSQVFDRFKQGDGSMTRNHGGLGLGLAIVRQLAELHHGSVEAHSDGIGKGCRFSLTLPICDDGASAEPGAAEQSRPGSELLSNIDVLIVDDEPDSRELAAEVLRQHGARPTCTGSAGEAFGAFVRRPPHLLLSDLGMPGEDGVSLIQRVRALPQAEGGAIPAIALSAYVRPQDRSRAVSAGYTSHLAKPFDPIELVTMVATLVARST